jgi:uncharacterized protein (DUF924 family)|nr:MAG: DUF924 domain-containing protein [Pseudomonadota bacterium]
MPQRGSAAHGAVIEFWSQAGRERWFGKDEAFDRLFRERFLDQHMAVAARRHDDWLDSPEGALALLILTDQFPRNAFRGTAHMYATDPLARHYARRALQRGHLGRIPPDLRVFMCLPFMHSEDLADQELCVDLVRTFTSDSTLDYAIDHRDIIQRFGRFPHRNPKLGRETTPEEEAFLAAGGFAG